MRLRSRRSPEPNLDVPGPDGLPVLGTLPYYARDPFGFMRQSARDHGPVVRWNFAGDPSYLISGPEEIERILVHENQHYVKGRLFQQSLGPVLGDGLLNSEGAFWRRQRHLIQPAFHPARLRRYASVMTERAAETVDGWRDGETRNVHEDMMALTLEIVASALFGVDIRDRAAEIGEALGDIMAHAEKTSTDYVPDWVPTPTNRRFRRAVETLDEIVYSLVEERKHAPGDDVISALLAADGADGGTMSDEQIRDEAMTLLLAGHETTALALTYTLFLLAQHPDAERKLLSELETALEGRAPTVEELAKLEYTERVVKESMRLYPPVYSILREPTVDVELGDYRIPTGSTLILAQWVVHRDPDRYDDPMAFRPERWAEGLEERLSRFGYFPFAGGPRRCLGDQFAMMEAQLLLATIVRRYHLELLSSPTPRLGAGITMRPKEPVEMRVHLR